MLLSEVAAASADVGSTSSRLAKIERLATVLREAGPDEVGVVVSWLSGDLPQRQIGVGWAALRSLPDAAADPSLTVERVHQSLSDIKAIAGAGSQRRRADALAGEGRAAGVPLPEAPVVRLEPRLSAAL